MEGRNVITRADGTRNCRACQYERNIKFNRAKRRPRMRWGKFSIEELSTIQSALFDADLGQDLYWEIQRYTDSLRGPDPQPVQSTPNHETLNNQTGSSPKLANQKQH